MTKSISIPVALEFAQMATLFLVAELRFKFTFIRVRFEYLIWEPRPII